MKNVFLVYLTYLCCIFFSLRWLLLKIIQIKTPYLNIYFIKIVVN